MTEFYEVRRLARSKASPRLRFFLSSRTIVIFALLVFLTLLIREAWLHEDAFITLRTIDNFVNGYGLRYNISQRVQTYTHPLWMLLLTVPYALTREPLFTTLFIAITISLVNLTILLRYLAPTVTIKLFAVVVLLSSRPFIDYSTSGLENPLSHLLLVLFLVVYLQASESPRNLFWLSLLAALAALNRPDTLLFYLPPLIFYFLRVRSIRAVLVGFAPLMAWLVFSLLYYGFPFPNSAYAKLNVYISTGDLLRQGTYYFQDVAWRDPLTALVITAGLFTAILERRRKQQLIAAGVILYLLYILRIGGDYMSGRFFTASLVVSVVLLSTSKWLNSLARFQAAALIGLVLLLGLLSAHPVFFPVEYDRRWRDDHGITDERQYYEGYTGILENLAQDPPLRKHWLANDGILAREEGQPLLVKGGIGLAGYFAGPDVHIVDNYALADSLLSHLPVGNPDFWRIGHFNRSRPPGLEESLIAGENRIQDANIAAYYDKLLLLARGPIFDFERIKTIWRFNTGQYDYLIDADHYIAQQMVSVSPAAVGSELPEGTEVESENVVYIPYQGLRISYPDRQHGSVITLGIDNNYTYRVLFLYQGIVEESLLVEAESPIEDTLGRRTLVLPDVVTEDGFDEIRIRPYVRGMDAKKSRGLGYVIIAEEDGKISRMKPDS